MPPQATTATNQAPSEVDCIGCGYNLTGVAIGNACPECGVPVSQTIDHGRAMTRRQAVTVVLRLAALIIFFMCLTLVDFVAWFIVAISGKVPGLAWNDDQFGFMLLVQVMPLLVRVSVGVLLWFNASRLAVWLVKHDGAVLQHGRAAPRELLSIGLVLLGLVALIHGVTMLLFQGVNNGFDLGLNNSNYNYPNGDASVLVALIWTLAGLVLIGSPRLRAWLARDISR